MSGDEELADRFDSMNVSDVDINDVEIDDYKEVLAYFKRSGLNLTRAQFSKLVRKKNSF
jgi:hypothetical protein